MTSFLLPITRRDGSRVLCALSTNVRAQVFTRLGVALEVLSSPDQSPPNGQLSVTLRDASEVRVPFSAFYGASMDFTTLTRLKAQITGITGSADDTYLSDLITSVSTSFERYMRRAALKEAITEEIRLRQWKQIVTLKGAPIESVTSIKYASHSSEFATIDAMDPSSYMIRDEGETGLIEFLVEMPLAPGFLQVVYIGGLAADQADLELLYPDLVQAADMQCAYEFQRRTSVGGNISFNGGSTTFDQSIDMLPRVRKILDAYRRHYIGA